MRPIRVMAVAVGILLVALVGACGQPGAPVEPATQPASTDIPASPSSASPSSAPPSVSGPSAPADDPYDYDY